MFFQNPIYITNLYTVSRYESKHIAHKSYSAKLRTYELIYKVTGKNSVCYHGKTVSESSGTVRFLPKGDHRNYTVDIEEPGICFDIYFDTITPLPDEMITFSCTEHKKIHALFEKLYNIWQRKQEGYQQQGISLFYEIQAALCKAETAYHTSKQYLLIRNGVDYLHTHYTDRKLDYTIPPTLCGISPTYFKRIFHQKYGVPPIAYVNRLRMEYAQELLKTNKYRVAEIADQCGFENIYYFSKRFKEYFGNSPTQYKKDLE